MKKFQSRTGLPEALGSNAHQPTYVAPLKVSEQLCGIPGCRSVRTKIDQTMPDGRKERVYEQGKGDVVIRTKDGTVHGYVCCFHYQKILDAAGKDQLSCVPENGINAPQEPLPLKPSAPPNLENHLSHIEDQLADRYASQLNVDPDLGW